MNTIFRHFIKRDTDSEKLINIRKGLSMWFINSFPQGEFTGIDGVFFAFTELSTEIGIPISERYMEIFIQTELKQLIYRLKLKVVGTEGLVFEDPISLEQATIITADILRAEFYNLQQESEEIEDFQVEILEFINTQRDERVLDILMRAHETATGVSSRRIGSADAAEMINYESQTVLDIYNKEKLSELGDIFPALLKSEDGNKADSFRFAFNTGIESIDNDTRGIFTSRLYGIEAPPGAGKTRFALGCWIYSAAVHYGLNCVYHTLEQKDVEMEAILISLHLFFLYNKVVPDSWILTRNTIKDEDIRRKIDIAEADLFKSGKYGKIKVKHKGLFLESFINVFKQEDKLEGGYDVFAVDYMSLIEQEPPKPGAGYSRRYDDWKVIQQSYRKFKSYCLHNDKVGIAINQLNKEGTEKANAGKDTDENDAQGGMEVYRSTDYNIVIGGTSEMKAQNKRRLTNPKKRSSKGVGALILDCYIEIAYFFQSKKANL